MLYGKLLQNSVHGTLRKLNQKKTAVKQVEVKYREVGIEAEFYPEMERRLLPKEMPETGVLTLVLVCC